MAVLMNLILVVLMSLSVHIHVEILVVDKGFCVDMLFSSKCHDMSICVVIKQM